MEVATQRLIQNTADEHTFLNDFSDEHFRETCDDLGYRLGDLLSKSLLYDLENCGFECRIECMPM